MKRIISIALAVLMALSALSFVVLAQDGSGKKDVGEHEHQLMKMANMNSHYSECTICFELFDVGNHTFVDGKCSVCGHDELINPFLDVANNAWYAEDVLSAVSTGLINGKGDGAFKPDDYLTYAEAVKLAACMNQLYTNGKVTLENGQPWYQTYVDFCKKNNIIRNDYTWSDYTTRIGYMYIFASALPDEAYEEINTIDDNMIPDVSSDAPYAACVYKLYRAGIVTGVDAAHNCNPTANIKRSEVAVIVARMMDPTKRKSFDLKAPDGSQMTDKSSADDVEFNKGNESIEVEFPDGSQITDKGSAGEFDYNKDHESIIVGGDDSDYDYDYDYDLKNDLILDDSEVKNPATVVYNSVTIVNQPKDYIADNYGIKTELEVEVKGGKEPYTYEWFYNGYRNQKNKIENGDYIKDVNSAALVMSVEKENSLLGVGIFCKVTDADGVSVNSNTAKVYGPFSMTLELSETIKVNKEYSIVGTVVDGVLAKGEKISVERNGKIIAIGVAKELKMFSKSLDETTKGDRSEIVFEISEGVRPASGDIVIKYNASHKLDTSDIVN